MPRMNQVRPEPDVPGDTAADPAAGEAATSAAGPNADVAPIRRTTNYTSAVYGSVLAATVVVSSGDLRAPLTLAVLRVVSGITFWFAHVYAATVAARTEP